MGGQRRGFPSTSTDWRIIETLRSPDSRERRSAQEQMIKDYWKPVYCWLRCRGYNDADAKDLVQSFFLDSFTKGRFEKADRSRGRFRAFMLTCLRNFVSNCKRDDREPLRSSLSIDAMKTDGFAVELVAEGSPEASFNRAWSQSLLLRVARSLERECEQTGKQVHYELFRRRIIEPIVEGGAVPSASHLAHEMCLTEKQVSNYLITARRAYQRLLRQEIRQYASSDEEVAEEIRDLFSFAGD